MTSNHSLLYFFSIFLGEWHTCMCFPIPPYFDRHNCQSHLIFIKKNHILIILTSTITHYNLIDCSRTNTNICHTQEIISQNKKLNKRKLSTMVAHNYVVQYVHEIFKLNLFTTFIFVLLLVFLFDI